MNSTMRTASTFSSAKGRNQRRGRHRFTPRLALLESRCLLSGDLPSPLTTITVLNWNDSGPGSLRQAILDGSANPSQTVINFANGVFEVDLDTAIALPAGLTIEGGSGVTIQAPQGAFTLSTSAAATNDSASAPSAPATISLDGLNIRSQFFYASSPPAQTSAIVVGSGTSLSFSNGSIDGFDRGLDVQGGGSLQLAGYGSWLNNSAAIVNAGMVTSKDDANLYFDSNGLWTSFPHHFGQYENSGAATANVDTAQPAGAIVNTAGASLQVHGAFLNENVPAVTNSGGTAVITDSRFVHNDAFQFGLGASVNMVGGSLTVDRSSFTGGLRGPAIRVLTTGGADANKVALDKDVFDNVLTGALYLVGAQSTVTNSDFTNSAGDSNADGNGGSLVEVLGGKASFISDRFIANDILGGATLHFDDQGNAASSLTIDQGVFSYNTWSDPFGYSTAQGVVNTGNAANVKITNTTINPDPSLGSPVPVILIPIPNPRVLDQGSTDNSTVTVTATVTDNPDSSSPAGATVAGTPDTSGPSLNSGQAAPPNATMNLVSPVALPNASAGSNAVAAPVVPPAQQLQTTSTVIRANNQGVHGHRAHRQVVIRVHNSKVSRHGSRQHSQSAQPHGPLHAQPTAGKFHHKGTTSK